jgi:catechol 2,3-dioxygenase-like lactoylglutathione lyase family enzyme
LKALSPPLCGPSAPTPGAVDDMTTGVNHITLAVRDADRSYHFYVETLGSRPLARWSKGAYLLVGDLWLCLTLDERTSSLPRPEYSHIAFSVHAARFDDAAASIRASGAVIWQDNRSEGASLYFLDPDGHKLEIHAGDWRTRLAAMKDDPWEPSIEFFDSSDR